MSSQCGQLQKLYFETPSFNVNQFASAISTGLMVEEARLKNHTYYDDRHWDYLTYAMYRHTVEAFALERAGMSLMMCPQISQRSQADDMGREPISR